MALPLRHLTTALTTIAGLLVPAQRACAQPAPPPPAEFRVVSMADVATLFYDVGSKREYVNAGVGAFSRSYAAPKSREVLLYTEKPAADAAEPPLRVPLARARLPGEKPGPFLILLAPQSAGADSAFAATVVDHSLDTHPAATYWVSNFSKRRLAVNVADTDLVLAPGQSGKAPYPSTRKAWLKVAAQDAQGGWTLLSSSPHAVGGADSRTTVFLVDIPPSERDPSPLGIVVRRIREQITTDGAGVAHIR